MSRKQVENRLAISRQEERDSRTFSVGTLGITALFGLSAVYSTPGENRAGSAVTSFVLGVVAVYTGGKSISHSMTSAQLEGVLAQDDLYTEDSQEQQEVPTGVVAPVIDQEQI